MYVVHPTWDSIYSEFRIYVTIQRALVCCEQVVVMNHYALIPFSLAFLILRTLWMVYYENSSILIVI